MKRFECLKAIVPHVNEDDLVVVALGGMIDEWNSIRHSDSNLYLKIMGTITPVAYGIADSLENRRVISLDTDGSLLLNLGILCTLGNEQPDNLVIVVMDNECYEVIGGPPTHTSGNVDLAAMAKGAGIKYTSIVRTVEEMENEFTAALERKKLTLIVAKLERGTELFPEDERKRTDGHEDKYNFVRYIEDSEKITIIPREVKSVRKIKSTVKWDV